MHKNKIPPKLQNLFDEIENCPFCARKKNPYKHILGGGRFQKPKFFFIFINPTHLNISAHQNYEGKLRFPFIGVKYFWRFLSEVGLFSNDLVRKLYQGGWKIEYENLIETELVKNSLYLTNLVKCTKNNPSPPSKEEIQRGLIFLKKEISIVDPKYIVTFGILPFYALTGKKVLLKEVERLSIENDIPFFSPIKIDGKSYKIFPCYFPVGRGNPKKSASLLKRIIKFGLINN